MEKLSIPIIYEDEDVVVVNKPAGLIVHPDGKTTEPSVSEWLLEKYPDTKEVGEPLIIQTTNNQQPTTIFRPGIVHRIDRDTSGVLVCVKNQDAFIHMKEQFKNRSIEKVYRAFVYGELKENSGVIDKAIGRHNKDFRLRSAEHGARGALRDAFTEYTVLQKNKDAAYVEVRPKTGRTHQIRVHFKAISHPIVCDPLYAPKRECILGFQRLALHAYSLGFTLPNQTQLLVEAPVPEDFENAVSMLVEAK